MNTAPDTGTTAASWLRYMFSRSNTLPRNATLVAAAGQVSCDIGSQMAILNLNSGIYYGLDAVGARVWELIQRPRPLAEIESALLAEYRVEPSQLRPDLEELCETLAEAGLIEIRDEIRA